MSTITLPSRPDEREWSPLGPAAPDRRRLWRQLDPSGAYEEDDDLFGDDDDDRDDDELTEPDGEELDGEDLEDEDLEGDLDV